MQRALGVVTGSELAPTPAWAMRINAQLRWLSQVRQLAAPSHRRGRHPSTGRAQSSHFCGGAGGCRAATLPPPRRNTPGPQIDIVDEQNRVVGQSVRRLMRRDNLRHRATYIAVHSPTCGARSACKQKRCAVHTRMHARAQWRAVRAQAHRREGLLPQPLGPDARRRGRRGRNLSRGALLSATWPLASTPPVSACTRGWAARRTPSASCWRSSGWTRRARPSRTASRRCTRTISPGYGETSGAARFTGACCTAPHVSQRTAAITG
jgi:hypothetical protein